MIRYHPTVGSKVSVGIVGATGAVGTELLQILIERSFPVGDLRLFASERSAGQNFEFQDRVTTVENLETADFSGLNVVFFSAGASRSKMHIPRVVESGAIAIDNSSAFRMDSNVPLVVPEINWKTVNFSHRVISVPNCTAIILLMAIHGLQTLGEIERVIVSTYQSASGAGAAAMDELTSQTQTVLDGGVPIPSIFPHPYAFNLFSHNTPVNQDGQNDEEVKVIEESKKILNLPSLKMNVTCIRVPVLRAHSESITVEFRGDAPSVESVRSVLSSIEGVRLVDDRERNYFPMPLEASGQDDVLVGRIRKDPSKENAICLFACGDQIRKGAALNAVQIAEKWLATFGSF